MIINNEKCLPTIVENNFTWISSILLIMEQVFAMIVLTKNILNDNDNISFLNNFFLSLICLI